MYIVKKLIPALLLSTLLVLNNCNSKTKLIKIEGTFLSSPYSVKYIREDGIPVTKAEIDSIFLTFYNTYDIQNENSEIYQFNKTGKIKIKNPNLYTCLLKNKELYDLTNGTFDPTVGKLVEIWGVNFEKINHTDSSKVKEALEVIGFDKVIFTEDSITTTVPGVTLDLGATFKGQAVDVLTNFLNSRGIKNYMIETKWGTKLQGKNKNKSWITKKKVAKTESDSIISNVKQINYTVANSQMHQKYFDRNGIKYAYTLNPKTGYPAESDVLSAYIFAPDCMSTNGLSTACMALGFEKSKELTQQLSSIRFIITYTNQQGETISYDSFSNK